MTQSSDDRLRIAAAQLDPSRFGELYEEHFYRVYAYIARRVGNRHLAEDLTADVFHEAMAGIGKFEWRGVPFAAWLLRIASRTIADHFQRSGREAGRAQLDERFHVDVAYPGASGLLPISRHRDRNRGLDIGLPLTTDRE